MEPTEVTALRGFTRRCCVAFLLFGVIALVLQAVGCFTVGWMIVDYGNGTVYWGLWALKWCVEDTCNTITIDEMNVFLHYVWTETFGDYREETMSGLFMLLVALVMFTCTAICSCSQNGIKLGVWSSLGASLLSGILAIAASASFGVKVRNIDDLPPEISMETPYSLILTGVGGLLAAVLALILALAWLIYTKPCTRGPESEPQPGYVLSPNPVVPMVTVYPPNYAINQATTPAVLQPTFQGMSPDAYKTAL